MGRKTERSEHNASSNIAKSSLIPKSETASAAFEDLRSDAMVQRRHRNLVGTSRRMHEQLANTDTLQRQSASRSSAANNTGLPDQLKAGIEALSGMSMDGVKVHYNSSAPAQLNAYAYAQGKDIHLGKGQEHHLPHEAWHVVQQAQGRVAPTVEVKGKAPINDDAGLEAEADRMGSQAVSTGAAVTLDDALVSTVSDQARTLEFAAHSDSGLQKKALDDTNVVNAAQFVAQREEVPNHRLDPHISEPTEKEEDEFKKKYNRGDNGTGDEARERKDMLNRAEYARALNKLAAIEDYYDPGANTVCSLSQKETYYQSALGFYVGTREKGHEIWVGLQKNLQQLIEQAFYKGYAVNRADIQEVITEVALAKTLLESNPLGSAGRSTTMRR